MTATKAPRLTLTAAAKAARELGFTLRKTAPGESEIVVYRKGEGMDSPRAYFTDCPVDALLTARAMAADDNAGRLTLTGKPATAAALATVAAEDNAKAAADYARDFVGYPEQEARRLTAEAREELDAAKEAPAAFDATQCHYDATRAAMLYRRALKAFPHNGTESGRARLQEARDAATALAALAFELMIQAAARSSRPVTAETVADDSAMAEAARDRDSAGAFALAAFKAREEGKTGEDVTAAAEAAAEAARGRKEARDAGHAAEDRADMLKGEERAAELDKAADHFDRAGGVHYPARAKACREEAAATRRRVELDAMAARDAAKAARSIDVTPTWRGIMPGLVAVLESGTAEGRAMARAELFRLADMVDAANAGTGERQSLDALAEEAAKDTAAGGVGRRRSLSAAVNPEAPEGRKAARRRLKTRRELEAAAEAPGIAGELARMGLQAVNVAKDSGGFPLYAFRDRRPIDPEELDSMIYGRSAAGYV